MVSIIQDTSNRILIPTLVNTSNAYLLCFKHKVLCTELDVVLPNSVVELCSPCSIKFTLTHACDGTGNLNLDIGEYSLTVKDQVTGTILHETYALVQLKPLAIF